MSFRFSAKTKTAALTAGSHTFKLQWLTSANTAQCRPITGAIDSENASLTVEEVNV